jgi:hypothetical protein
MWWQWLGIGLALLGVVGGGITLAACRRASIFDHGADICDEMYRPDDGEEL